MLQHNQLKALAAITWYLGAVVLMLKAGALLDEALALQPDTSAIPWIYLLGITIGLLKARLIFHRSCRKNLMRIEQLQKRSWAFFRPRFFLFLALMIGFGSTLSRAAHGDFTWLLAVATLDLSLATALLAGSLPFWRPLHALKEPE